jgi:hypothetical protein
MRFRITTLSLLCLAGASLCQTTDVEPQFRRLRADIEFLTSGVLAERVSLSPEAEIAARYIASDFERTAFSPQVATRICRSFG